MLATRVGAGILCASLLLSTGCWTKSHSIAVGSKNTTEQIILGELIAKHLEHRLGAPVIRRTGMGATDVLHSSLLAGDVDLYPEYTGIALRSILRITLTSYDRDVVFDRVQGIYRSEYHIEWLPPLGFNSTFGLGVTPQQAEIHKLTAISDAERRADGWKLAYAGDFANRPDGLPLLTAHYRLPFRIAPILVDSDQVYNSLTNGTADLITVRSTDGLLANGNVKVLPDDRAAFPPYEAAIVVREPALRANSKLGPTLRELSGKVNEQAMRRMNAEVDLRKRSPAEVAAEFLQSSGLK